RSAGAKRSSSPSTATRAGRTTAGTGPSRSASAPPNRPAADVTIVAVRARALDVPMKKPFGIAGGAQTVAANVLVEVELASGTRGIGEAAPFPAFNGETQRAALDAIAAADLVGQDGAGSMLDRVGVASAACAIETAIADARARERRVSLRVLW